jgi:hypothetical protein
MKITISIAARSDSKTCAEISQLVGVQPDSCKEKGSLRSTGNSRTRETVWKIQTSISDPTQFEDAVDSLCVRIEPHASRLRGVDGVAFDLDCAVRLDPQEQLSDIGLSARAVRTLADLGAELGISFY